jgi:hypothetical protein
MNINPNPDYVKNTEPAVIRRGSYRAKVEVETEPMELQNRNSVSYLKNNHYPKKNPVVEKVKVMPREKYDEIPVIISHNHARNDISPLRSKVNIDPLIKLTPIKRPNQRKNPKREIIKEITRSRSSLSPV